MKKLIAALVLISVLILPTFASATVIPEGAVVKTADNPDVYIIKYKNGKQFKRLVLNPQVFESYGHLKWENVLTVSNIEMGSFVNSDFVRVDGQTDIYQLIPEGDTGSKHYLASIGGVDGDAIYTINAVDFGNYITGAVYQGSVPTFTPIPTVAPTPKPNYDQELSQLIAKSRQNISTFEGAIKESDKFTPVIRATMNKYPNESSMQQSGQELLNENDNIASISRKAIVVETDRINKLSSYLGLGIFPTVNDFSQITLQYNDYLQQYNTSNNRMNSLINTFVLNEKSVLERLIQEKQQKLDNLKNLPTPTPTPAQTFDPQIESALAALRTTLSDIESQPVAMNVINGRKERAVQDWMNQNSNVFSSQVYITSFNAILSSYGLYWMMIK